MSEITNAEYSRVYARSIKLASAAIRSARREHGLDEDEYLHDDARDSACDEVFTALLDTPDNENIDAADLSDVAYTAVADTALALATSYRNED